MWKQLSDAHHWSASVGAYRLRVQPEITNGALVYRAELSDAALNDMWAAGELATVDEAKEAARAALQAELQRLTTALAATEDEAMFGHGAWVYCGQHMNAHPTGWCSVSVRDKVGLGISGRGAEVAQEARAKCQEFGLPLANQGSNQ